MEKVFLIKRKIGRHQAISIQVPPHEALIDTYLKHMYRPDMHVMVAHKSKVPHKIWERSFEDFDEEGNIEVNLEKAKKLYMQHFRFKRTKALLGLDQDYCKYFDNKNQQKMNEIETQKQILRDLPLTINLDAAHTIADLEKMWPTEILGVFGEM